MLNCGVAECHSYNFSANQFRPKWWMLLVASLNVFLPLIAAIAIMVDPEACIIPEDQPRLTEDEGAMFRSTARNMAAGSLLSVVIAYFSVTTNEIAKLRLTVVLQLFYMSFLVINMCMVLLEEHKELDVNFSVLTFLSIVLHTYMYLKIRFHEDASEPLLDEDARKEIVIESPNESQTL